MLDKVRDFMKSHEMFAPGDRVVVGLSGGADSVCLLEVLFRLRKELSIELSAVHIHHGLRGEEADRDAYFSEKLCESRSVPFQLVRRDMNAYALEHGLSSEEAGRILRYQALSAAAGEGGHSKIAVAHHQDDHVETILLNLFRGTGLKGLGGIQPVRDRIVRPLLCVGKEEIRSWLAGEGITFCEDSTNGENDYTRNRLRNQVIPLIVSVIHEGAAQNILRAGMLAGQADAYIEKRAAEILKEYGIREEGKISIGAEVISREDPVVGAYLARGMIELVCGQKKDITARHIEAVLGLTGKQVGRTVSLPYGLAAGRDYQDVWIGKPSEKEKAGQVGRDLNLSAEMTVFPYKKGSEIPKNQYTKWFDYDKIKGMLSVRTRKSGDFITISGGGKKTVKAYLIDEKIPESERGKLPLLADGDHVLWIIGYRISEYYKITDETQTILQVIFDGGRDDGR